MRRFADLQREFAGAVLEPEAAVPAPVLRKAGGVPSRRFGVYRNNVYASLIDVLAGRFPVVARLVGEEFFRAMARIYIEREPPRSAVLIRYGASFPNFVASFPPAASLPYLADMARLEWGWHAAYHAEDAAPLPLADLARAVERAEDAVLTLHPSLGVVRSLYPIVSIFELNRQGGACCKGARPSSLRSKRRRASERPPPPPWRRSQASTSRPISPGSSPAGRLSASNRRWTQEINEALLGGAGVKARASCDW